MIPARALAILKTSSAGSFIQHQTEARTNVSNAGNLLRLSATKDYDELGPAESRAVDKVLSLPKVGGQ